MTLSTSSMTSITPSAQGQANQGQVRFSAKKKNDAKALVPSISTDVVTVDKVKPSRVVRGGMNIFNRLLFKVTRANAVLVDGSEIRLQELLKSMKKGDHALLYTPNHSHKLDLPVAWKVLGPFSAIGAQEIFDYGGGVAGKFFHRMGVVPVKRGVKGEGAKSLERFSQRLGECKEACTAYPEGQNTGINRWVSPLKDGVTRAAMDVADDGKPVAIVPVSNEFHYVGRKAMLTSIAKTVDSLESKAGIKRSKSEKAVMPLNERMQALFQTMVQNRLDYFDDLYPDIGLNQAMLLEEIDDPYKQLDAVRVRVMDYIEAKHDIPAGKTSQDQRARRLIGNIKAKQKAFKELGELMAAPDEAVSADVLAVRQAVRDAVQSEGMSDKLDSLKISFQNLRDVKQSGEIKTFTAEKVDELKETLLGKKEMTAEAIRDYINNVEAMKPTVEEFKQDVNSLKEIMGLTLYPESYLEPPADLPAGVNVDDVMLTQLVDMASGLSRDIAGVKTPLYRRQKVKNIWRKLPGYSVVHPLVREAWFLRKGQVEARVKLNEPIMILPQDVKAAIAKAERTGDRAAVKALTAEYTDLLAERIQGGLDDLFGQTEAMTATRQPFD